MTDITFGEFAAVAGCVAEHMSTKRGKALDLASIIYNEAARVSGLGSPSPASLDDLMQLFKIGKYAGDGNEKHLRARAKEVWATFESARQALADLRKEGGGTHGH